MNSTTTSSAAAATTTISGGVGTAQTTSGISLVAFATALSTSLVVFGVQLSLFLLLRNKLARIFKPKTFLVPERERTNPPPISPWGLVSVLMRFKDREIINKCGLDAYFFLRYLQTLLVIFVPIALVVIPILIPINFVGGIGQSVTANATKTGQNVTGLNTLAWPNLRPENYNRRWAHLLLALGVIIWVCTVFFLELRVYIKVRQDYLTSAEHRLRASANTVLVTSVPEKWLTEEALRGLFDVFPGGVRNIWLTRDFTKLLDKISKRATMHSQLEAAESDLIRAAKKAQLKKRKADEKKEARRSKVKAPTKEERARRDEEEDRAAQQRAEGPGGMSAGDTDINDHGDNEDKAMDSVNKGEEAPETANGLEKKHIDKKDFQDQHDQQQQGSGFGLGALGSGLGGGLTKFGQGIGQGLMGGIDAIGKAGEGVVGGAKAFGQGVEGEIGKSGGFEAMMFERPKKDEAKELPSAPPTRGSDRERRKARIVEGEEAPPKTSFASDAPLSRHTHSASNASQDSAAMRRPETANSAHHVNTTRKLTNISEMYITAENKWYQFWKPPPGGYASPVPQTADGEGNEFPFKKDEKEKKTTWQTIKASIPFLGGEEEVEVDYPEAINPDYKEDREGGAEWEKWVKAKDRPHHRLPWFDWTPTWFPGFPLLHKKVDTIYYCRGELARLNMEIEEDQQHPERYPIMRSAFIQFNEQVAAHMACQSVAHHVPQQMAPRVVEVSPRDVIWDNMAIKWWDEWAREALVWVIVIAMVILWAFPVAWTASLSQIDALIAKYSWLDFLQQNPTVYSVAKAVAGVLPALVLSIILYLVPVILSVFAGLQGVKTQAQKTEKVQVYYFMFLFVQVFLIVSITSSLFQVLQGVTSNPTEVPAMLAINLPKAANYFFSYMILQALSTSSGTLLQIGALITWYVLAKLLDNTARSKWSRNVNLSSVTWGSFFPVYTNFACIALIYSVVAPLISIFAIITFSLLWVANRYAMLYVYRFQNDTGGVLFPRAINQTFTGLYVMELCLVGLFFIQEDANGDGACFPQGIIMVVSLFLTALYQFLLNWSFGPLFRYLPVTFEDEAVLRDIAFRKAQNRRWGIPDDDDDEGASLVATDSVAKSDDIELQQVTSHSQVQKHGRGKGHRRGLSNPFGHLNPVKGIKHAGSWAGKEAGKVGHLALAPAERQLRNATEYRRLRRQADLEAQRAMGEALYGSNYNDEIEDLTPHERDELVKKAFQHYAMRARRPTVWIPRDDIGVSDDEIQRTREFSDYIWISNEGTALDSKVRVVYGRNPPDFDSADTVNL